MASLQTKVDAIKASIASTSKCTPATVVTLKELLLPEPDAQPPVPKSSAGRAKTTTGSRAKSSAGRDKTGAGELGVRDRTALATHVINVALKSLSEAAKPLPSPTPCKDHGDLRQAVGGKKNLGRSAAPLSPIHPNLAQNPTKPVPAFQSTGCLATVECARVAFACLRLAKDPAQPGQTDFQLENGMLALVGKLLALGMHEQALKELKVLKRRLDGSDGDSSDGAKKMDNSSAAAATAMADLIKFEGKITKSSLSTVTGCQIHVLKLVAATKKASHIEAILPHLRETNAASPLNLLTLLAKAGDKEAAKVARQMASLSQLLLSLAPNISSQEDMVATEPRLSPSPVAAFELQTLAFRTQMRWWKLASHQGNVDDDLVSPFARCARAFVRRHKNADISMYKTIETSFDGLMELVRAQKYRPSTAFTAPLASIYQILGSVAQTERCYDEAHRWLLELKKLLVPGQDSSVRTCSVSARLLAAALKTTEPAASDMEQLIGQVIEGLDGSLSGTMAELNELLESLSLARRSVVGMLINILGPNGGGDEASSSEALTGLLKAFVLRYPRFVRRWMGLPPGKDAAAKHVLQFEQRRQLVLQSVNQVLDATLMVVKGEIQSAAGGWQPVDDVLQHCHSLLESLSAATTLSSAKAENLGGYRVKISSLYFSVFTSLRKKTARSKEEDKQILLALSRSIDSVKDCTAAEKEKSQLLTKLELFADLCRGAGRTEDAVRTLRSVCTDMMEDGTLSEVVAALDSQSPVVAWAVTDRACAMSRTLRSVAKLDRSWSEWTSVLPEAERAAVLEHLMRITATASVVGSLDPGPAALLRIYTLEKHPIRRLRVLLHLLHQNIGTDQVGEITSHVNQALEQLHNARGDASLACFIPHLEAFCSSLAVLTDTDGPFPASAAKAVSSWASMVAQCRTQDDLFARIDDPQGLLDHLRSLNQLAGLRGENLLQISIVELSISISRLYSGGAESSADALVLHHSQLLAQYVNIGLFPQALETMSKTETLVAEHEGLSRRVVAEFYIAQAEYHAGVGSMETAMTFVGKANHICGDAHASWAQSKAQATLMLSMAALLQSIVTLEAGDIQEALSSIKTSVRLLSNDWAKLEGANRASASSSDGTEKARKDREKESRVVVGPRYWDLASPLLRSLLHISSVYAHIGMFQETIYYAESAWKVAESTQSSLYQAQVSTWTGSVYRKASQISKALGHFRHAEDQLPGGISAWRVRVARQIGEFYWDMGEDDKAAHFLQVAEETAHLLSREKTLGSATSRKQATARSSRAGRGRTKRSPPPEEIQGDMHQASLLAAIAVSRSLGHIHQKDWTAALAALEQVKKLPKLTGVLSQEQVLTAVSLIGHSMEQMVSDPVFSVMQDSTISLPAVSSPSRPRQTAISPMVSRPKRGGGKDTAGNTAKGSIKEENGSAPPFADALRQAQELLVEAHASALASSDSSMVRRISTLLQSTIIFLSATSTTRWKSMSQSGLATVAVDMARNVTWRREQQTLGTDAESASSSSSSSFSSSFSDMASFQKHYIDVVPPKWSVISISLSDNRHDLCITKFQSGHTPFILRLPLERANCRDADSDVFSFDHGRDELLDIIRLANETSHSARDFSAKGERGAWWAEREALDKRLQELLMTVETTWLGGFKGIFSQHQRRTHLLARFQKSFHQMLDRFLPSRSGSSASGSGSKGQTHVTLDPRILDLFIGLGDASDPDYDFDEALNDLLYFVVDILQFHGERNAYDEIDFDAMVVETYDILRGYHDAAKSDDDDDDDKEGEGVHTILVLDKALHAFPWESLPCMHSLAVSRVPSLAALGQLILTSNPPSSTPSSPLPQGHYISPSSGTCILNPSSDLKNTQSFFQPAFSALASASASWTCIVDKPPDESDFERALSASDITVYFGHGSGAQYIRAKTIRRLRCRPATFLMGCSSAALTDAGEFESYGPVWNYMMAGCPAVVGTLWDVTDRDIDRFAGRAFEEWRLFPRGTFGGDDEDHDDHHDTQNPSLAEAVARARSACRFRYLNAAAVVMYGIPVYLE